MLNNSLDSLLRFQINGGFCIVSSHVSPAYVEIVLSSANRCYKINRVRMEEFFNLSVLGVGSGRPSESVIRIHYSFEFESKGLLQPKIQLIRMLYPPLLPLFSKFVRSKMILSILIL